jgi:hypothetical protein
MGMELDQCVGASSLILKVERSAPQHSRQHLTKPTPNALASRLAT